ncbi:MAG: SPOR domain-containing protein [bacterium]
MKNNTRHPGQFILFMFILVCFLKQSCKKFETQNVSVKSVSAQLDTTTVKDSSQTVPTYLVQVAAFLEPENAEKLRRKLQESGLPAYVVAGENPLQETFYRLRIGPFTSREQAQTRVATLQNLGYTDAYILLNPELVNILLTHDSSASEIDTVENVKKQLTFGGVSSHPLWSPTGREIAFYKTSEQVSGIYSIGTGGGFASKIIESSDNREITPQFIWSPRGDKIVFVARELNKGWEPVENLYLINKDGSNLKLLLTQDNFPFKIQDLMWSPDGRALAFNAKYERGADYSHLIQRVLILSVHEMLGQQNFQPQRVNSRFIHEPSHLDRNNCALGWRNRNELLFLTIHYLPLGSSDEIREIWSYHFESRQRKKLLSGHFMQEFQKIGLASEDKALYYSQRLKILKLNLQSGQEQTVVETPSIESLIRAFTLTNSNTLLYLAGHDFWRCDINGGEPQLLDSFNSTYFTLSPTGKKLCFDEKGYLFTLKF